MPGGQRMCCHCLLLETAAQGLVLVDCGLGAADMKDPAGRLGSWFRCIANPLEMLDKTAHAQVAALGLDPADVRHVVMTHLDLDHGGGLADFPDARVHVAGAELRAAQSPSNAMERRRFRHLHWAHGPRWVVSADDSGEDWRGLPGTRQLEGLPPEILMVPLPGHTPGHCGVAVEGPDGPLLHAGDSIMRQAELTGGGGAGMALYHRMADGDHARGKESRALLRRLAAGGDVRITCSHDYGDFLVLSG